MKKTEENDIWEWRGFGVLRQELLAEIRSHPVRMDVKDQEGFDLYYAGPSSPHNVKLRRSEYGWILKLKPMLATGPRSIELYRERSQELFTFPLSRETVHTVERMLAVKLPSAYESFGSFTRDELNDALMKASPPVIQVPVEKVRSQYEFDKAWIEVARVIFPHQRIGSLSIHSTELTAVDEVLDYFEPKIEFGPLNYVEACRRWG